MNIKREQTNESDSLKQRLAGRLPVVHIAGHPFYVDIRCDYLRPKDDFSTMGISFTQLEDYMDQIEGYYRFPYNPATHNLYEIDLRTITQIPEGILIVEIPTMGVLDAVAYSEKYDYRLESLLPECPLEMERTAKIIPWDETNVPEIVEENKKKLALKNDEKTAHKPQRKRSRGL